MSMGSNRTTRQSVFLAVLLIITGTIAGMIIFDSWWPLLAGAVAWMILGFVILVSYWITNAFRWWI